MDICKWIKHEGIEFCIFDVLNKLHTAEENDNTKMTAVMTQFDRIRTETGCDVVVIHHDAETQRPAPRRPAARVRLIRGGTGKCQSMSTLMTIR